MGRDRPQGLSLSFNGGKDCTLLLHIYLGALHAHSNQSSLIIPAVYIAPKRGDSFVELDEFVDSCVQTFGLGLWRIRKDLKPGLELYRLKEPEVKAVLMGNRRGDPHSRTPSLP